MINRECRYDIEYMAYKILPSLRSRLIFTLLLIVTFILVAVGYFFYVHIKNLDYEDFKSDLLIQSNMLSVAISRSVWDFNEEQINEIINSI